MGNTEVETIGVRLTLDASGFAGGADKATASMNAFTAAAERAVSGAGGMKALGGAQVAGGGRAVAGGTPAQMQAVNVPLTVNAESLASLRAQIIKGLGSIPITITPQMSKAIAAEAKSVVSAVSTPAIGTRSGAARAVETAVRNNLPTRAHGGAVQQGRDVLVGERGPEIIRPRSSGMVLPDINAYHREQARLRKAEAELAALEYQIQQRGKRRVAANRGGYSESEIRQLELLAAKLQGGENISARAHGGPAHKGGLPKGYHIEFYSPQSNDFDIRNFGGRLDKPGPGFKPVKKPVILSKDYAAGLVAIVMKGDKVAATFPFSYRSDPEQWGVPTPAGSFHPDYSITGVEHRRKGLATAAYVKTERFTGRPIAPSSVQLTRGKAFWAQKDRPFGKIFGDRPVDARILSTARREEEYDRYTLEYQRRQAASGQGPTTYDPVQRARAQAIRQSQNLLCPTCGTAAGPFLAQSGLDAHISFAHRPETLAGGRPWGGLGNVPPLPGPSLSPIEMAAAARAPRREPPAFGQPLPTRARTRAQRRNDPQEQMRRVSYGENGPWTATSEWNPSTQPRAHVPQPAPAFGENQFIPDRPGVRFRARGGAVEISRLPGGGGHYAPRPEGLYHAIQDTINHYQDHSAPGGYVGVAPVGRGYAVQLHNAAGEIESWRILRNIKKAGFGAMAYRATMENEGGTFPLSGGPQPPKGYAVGIATGTSHLVEDPNNFRDFLKQFNAQKQSQLAAGSFPPYVGTWLHEGQIHIDPAAVLGRKREADMVARAKAQLAFFDLKRFDEIPTSGHKLRANAERIQQLIMAGRKRESGGMVENVRLSTLLPLLREDRETYPRTGQGATDLGELTGDIAARGIQKPIALRYDPSHHAAMVDDGNHRLAVARRLGLETVPAYAISSGPQSKRHYKLVGLSGSPVDAPRGALLAPSSIGLRADGGWVVPSSTPKNPLRGLMRLPENARDLHANIRAHAETIKPEVVNEARDWWTIAHAQAVGDLMDPIIGGKTSWQSLGMDALSGLGAFAAASSGQEWRSNRAIVRHLLETGVPQTSGSSNVPGFGETSFSAGRGLGPIEDAWAFLMGREGSPTGPKRGAMFQNITGLDPNAITYDSRMSQIITAARRHTGPNSKTFWKAPAGSDMIRKLGIGAMEDLYPEYAKRWDLHNLSEFQAILWSGLDTNVNAAHKGAGLGTDWLRTQRGISIPRHPGLEIPFHRAAGGPALGGMTPPLNQIAKPGFVSSMFQTAADWANDPFMAIMAWQQQADQHKARGGYVPNRDWERRRERLRQYRAGVFNPKRIERVGPPRLNEDFVGAPLPFTGGTLVGDRRWNETMGSLNDPRRWTRALAGNYMRGVYGTNWTKGGHAEGGPVLGPLQRRILGLPEPPKVEMPKPVEPFEPEWLKRARTSKLPPKIYREGGGPVSHLFTVADQLGLHMRPSAHLARMAADFDAFISVENLTRGMPQRGVVDAKYMHHLLALGARQGDQLRLRATGTDAEAAVRAIGGLIESPGLTRIASANRSLERVDPQRMRAAEIFAKFTGREGGGPVMSPWVRRALENNLPAKELSPGGKGLYIVGEIGRELFVPKPLTPLIPKKVMDQIPKAQGGMQVIGQKPNSLFAPPEDGIIVPNRLMHLVPHRQDGGETLEAAFQQSKVDPYKKIRERAAREFETLHGGLRTPQNMFAIPRTPPPGPSFAPSTATLASLGLTKPGAGVSTGPILTPAAEAAGKMAAPINEMALAAEKLQAAFTGLILPVQRAAKQPSVATAGPGRGGRKFTDEQLTSGPALFGDPVWQREHDALMRSREASRPPTERVSPRHRPQATPTAGPTVPAGGFNNPGAYQEWIEQQGADVQAAMGGGRAPRAPRGMQGASARMGAARRAAVSPEQADAYKEFKGTLADIMGESSAWQQVMSGRTPRGGIAQLASMGLGGRGKMLQLQTEARHQQRQLSGLVTPETAPELNKYVNLQADLMGARGKERDSIKRSIEEYKKAPGELGKVISKFDDLRATTVKMQPSTGNIIRNLGVVIGATTVYGMAMSLASKGIDAGSEAAGKFVDQMTGFRSTSTAATSALAQATYESHGNMQATMAQAAVTAGLSKDMLAFVSTSLDASVTAKAGQKAQQATADIFRASMGSQTGPPQGLYGGYGGVLGSALFAEQMGGGKGFMETVAGQFSGYSKAETGGNGVTGTLNQIATGANYVTSPNEQAYIDYKAKAAGMATPGDVGASTAIGGVGGALAGAAIGSILPGPGTAIGAIAGALIGSIGAGNYSSNYQMTPEQKAAQLPKFDANIGMGQIDVNARTNALNDLGSAADRAGKNMEVSGKKSVKVTWEVAKSWDEVDKAVAIATKAGDTYSANLAMQSNIVMKVNGQIVDSSKTAADQIKQHQDAIEQTAAGKNLVDPGVWAQLNIRQLQAQQQSRQAQQQLTMALEIPFQMTQNLLQQPLVAPGLGFFKGAETGRPSATATGLTGPAAGMAQQSLASTAAANSQLAAISGKGLFEALTKVGQFNPASLPDFAVLAIQANVSSAKIADLTTKMGKLNQEASQFNWDNQIRLASRAVGDALGAISGAGIKNTSGVSGTATQLGIWQGMSHKLDIMNQSLSLQLQQRSITTALAQAQFSAPGQTGEERYFAQVEAIQKASIQQQQLNIATQQFDLGQKIWNENANRAALDASKAITNMQLARNAEGYAITAQENIAKQQAILATKVAGMNAILGTATGNWSDALSAAAQGVGQFAGSVKDGVKAVYEALGYTKTTDKSGNTVLTAPTSGFGSTGTPVVVVPGYAPVSSGGGGGGKKNAAGFLGSIGHATEMIVGEAGPETVAIIRNARPLTGNNGPTDVALTDTNINAWMRAIQTSFPKVVLADASVASLAKAISDLQAAATPTVPGDNPKAANPKVAAPSFSPSTTANLPKNERLDRFAAALAKNTGLTVEASRKWAQAEVGPLNNLGIMKGPGQPAGFATPEAGAAAAANLIKSSSYYSGIMGTVGQSANAQLNAIARSPWHLGPGGLAKAGGVDPYYKRIFGIASGAVGITSMPTHAMIGEAGSEAVAILRNPRAATLAPSGGGVGPMNLTVNITGTSVRNDQDITDLARQVAAEVEKTLARKGQMFGLRGPAV